VCSQEQALAFNIGGEFAKQEVQEPPKVALHGKSLEAIEDSHHRLVTRSLANAKL